MDSTQLFETDAACHAATGDDQKRPALSWQSSPPPKDRAIVAQGQICWHDESGGGVDPFCYPIRWIPDGNFRGGGYWVFEYTRLALNENPDELVVIFHWIDLPGGAS